MEKYIHPTDEKIKSFIKDLDLEGKNLEETTGILLKWFDTFVTYSRLDAPFFPLQRSDLDVLNMLSGTCGDYSNLLVSVFSMLNYTVKYAYVKVDCYNNPQDHICIAVQDNQEWKLIDATLPYRKWHGFHCQHKEYELLAEDEFLKKMKKEEAYWSQKAIESGNEKYAGLFYAPWIHNDVILNTPKELESVFYLLMLENREKYQLFVYYLVYSEEKAFSPVMCRIVGTDVYYCFSEKTAEHIWDEKQWGKECSEGAVPEKYKTRYYENMRKSIQSNLMRIEELFHELK